MKETKQPRNWTNCGECDAPYGFVNCRISKGDQSICLVCAVEKEKRGEKFFAEKKISTGGLFEGLI